MRRLTHAAGLRRAAATAALVVGGLAISALAFAPAYADHPHQGRPKPWPACPHGAPRSTYPPRSCHVETDRTEVHAGGRLNLFGQGFRPGERVVIAMPADGVRLQTVRANADGVVLTSAVVPRRTSAGTHTVTMTAASGNKVDGVITVRPAAVDTRADPLPFAGSAAAIPLAAAGSMMVMAGGVVLTIVRRRRRLTLDGELGG